MEHSKADYSIEDRSKEMNLSKQTVIIIAIFLVGLLPRIFLAFNSAEIPASDALGYDHQAIGILEGKGFIENGKISSSREPLYSLFLAGIYYLFGHSYTAVRIIQAILGALVCLVVFEIAKNLFASKVAILAGLLSAFSPSQIKISEKLLSENLYTFLLSIAILLILKQTKSKNYICLALLGIFLGLASLTRYVIVFFPFFIIVFIGRSLIPEDYSIKKRVFSALVLIFFFILPILPWTIRNWSVHHKFIPIVSRTGAGLYYSYFPKDGKIYGFNISDENTEKAKLLGSETEESNYLIKLTLKFIKEHPWRVLKLEVLKTAYFWSPFDWEIIGSGVYNYIYGFIFPFIIFGLIIMRKRFRELLVICLPVFYAFLLALITYGSPRFRLPVEPYLIIMASAAIVHFISLFPRKILPVLITCGFFFFNFYLYAYSYQAKMFAKDLLEKIHLW